MAPNFFFEKFRSVRNYFRSISNELWILMVVYLILVVRRAWMGDDAFITLRTIDNWLNGYGLTFNVSERVQAYTHPLWMFILAGVYFFTREPYFTTLAISIICSSLAVVFLLGKVAKSSWGSVFAILILVLSNSFVDWSTSGLETPLSFLLLVIFILKYFQFLKNPNIRNIYFLSLISSLAMLNRLDTSLIFLPMLFFAWWYCGDKKQGFFYIVLGQAPLILWELFSIVYYGFPFPNTYYAKLNTGLADSQVIAQGAVYFLDSFRFDPITLVVIATSILVAFSERNRSRLQPLAIGIFFYLVYILRIGGDFMSGRFFALPLLGSVIIISQLQYKKIDTTKKMIYLFVVIFLGLVSPLPTYSVSDVSVRDLDLRNSRISNERLWYDDTTGLLNQNRITEIPFYPGRRTGEEFRRIASSSGHLVAFEDAIGMEGYYGGPGVHLIDLNALSDPLLARLPMVYNYMWRPGHYIRDELIPGYLETVTNGENQIKDSDLKTYYNYLSQIIHGDIWSLDRFRTIVNMNLGKFDFLINRFNYQFPEVVKKSYAQVNDVLSLPINCGTGQGISFKENGLLITLPEMVQNSQKFDIAIDDNKQFQIFFYKNQTILSTMILFPGLSEGVNHINYFQINESVSRAGFDSLLVLPLQGDPPYCLGFLELK